MSIGYEKVTTPMPNYVLRCPKNLEKELDTGANMYILDWWKINSSRFSILPNKA